MGGEQMIKAAFEGTKVGTNTHLDFSTVGRDFRKEAIQKGIVYTNIFPYVIWEMQDAVNDCLALAGTNNDDQSVHAWDEAVAFYAGSKTRGKGCGILESEAGKLQYRLADKRCKNFKTCANGFSGTSKVNQDIFALFNLGKEEARKSATSASTADCAQLNTLKEKIGTLSLVPFVQGTLRGRSRRKRCRDALQTCMAAGLHLKFVRRNQKCAGGHLPKTWCRCRCWTCYV